MKKIAFITLLLTVFAASVWADGTEPKVSLVVTKCNMFPNADLTSEDVLIGLFPTSIGHLLIPAKIDVTSDVDDLCRKFTRVIVNYPEEPLFLLKGLSNIRTGPVKTIFAGSKFIYPGEPIVLALPEQEKGRLDVSPQMLRAFGKAVEVGKDTRVYDYRVELLDNDRKQTLDYYKNSTPAAVSPGRKFGVLNLTEHMVDYDLTGHMELPTLIWAGDLDSDNKIDLFMWWPCPGKSAGVYSLYLSSEARNGDLVAKIPAGVRTYYSDTE